VCPGEVFTICRIFRELEERLTIVTDLTGEQLWSKYALAHCHPQASQRKKEKTLWIEYWQHLVENMLNSIRSSQDIYSNPGLSSYSHKSYGNNPYYLSNIFREHLVLKSYMRHLNKGACPKRAD